MRKGWRPFPHHSRCGHSITVDGFPSVASYYSLGCWLHYSVPVKHGVYDIGRIKSQCSYDANNCRNTETIQTKCKLENVFCDYFLHRWWLLSCKLNWQTIFINMCFKSIFLRIQLTFKALPTYRGTSTVACLYMSSNKPISQFLSFFRSRITAKTKAMLYLFIIKLSQLSSQY